MGLALGRTMRAGAILAAVLATSAVAHAQPDVAAAAPVKSPAVATALSLAGTAIPLVMIGAALDGDDVNMPLYVSGMVGTMVGPSFGHWYAHRPVTVGLLGRGVGAAMVGIGGATSLNCLGAGKDCAPDKTGTVIMISGAVLYAGGTIYDIATAGRAAREWNSKQVQIAPVLVGSGRPSALGLGISGAF